MRRIRYTKGVRCTRPGVERTKSRAFCLGPRSRPSNEPYNFSCEMAPYVEICYAYSGWSCHKDLTFDLACWFCTLDGQGLQFWDLPCKLPGWEQPTSPKRKGRAGLDVKSLQCRHCMLPYCHQCHKMKIAAWYHDTNICGKAKQAACYDLPFWALSARRTAEQQHDATSLNSLWVSLWFSPKSTCCRQNSIAAKWNIFLSFGLKVPLRFSMGGKFPWGGIKVLEENLVNVCRSQCAWSNHDGWQSIATLHSI